MKTRNLCITSWSYHRSLESGKLDALGFIKEAKKAGAAGVDLVGGHFPAGGTKTLLKVCGQARGMGVEIVALGMAGDLTVRAPSAQREMARNLVKWVRLASQAGASAIRVFAGDSSVCDSAERRANALLRGIGPLAQRARIRVSMENHWGISVNPDSARRMMRGLPKPWVGGCLDTGNFALDDRACLYGAKTLAPFAVHVHVKDFGGANAAERLDNVGSLRALARAGYDGWFSLEYEGKENELTEVPRAFTRLAKAVSIA